MLSLENNKTPKKTVDWLTIVIYLLLVVFGWLSIYSSTYEGEDVPFYDTGYRYGMQLIWIGISLLAAVFIVFLDSRYFFYMSHIVYLIAIVLMFLAVFVGKEINGAHSWISLGPISFQPVEFMKIGAALMLARVADMHTDHVDIWHLGLKFSAIIAIPVIAALVQNDLGSAMVFFIFFCVLYREGLPSWIFSVSLAILATLILSLILDREVLICLIFFSTVLVFAIYRHEWKMSLVYLASAVLFFLSLYIIFTILEIESAFGVAMAIVGALTLPLLYIYSRNNRRSGIWIILVMFIVLILLCFITDMAFDILKPHHQQRIMDLLGISTDPRGVSYNVTQSKIAIGSGGLTGHGFLQGTQTRYSYVPEQSTDFIFCTIGDEEGFLGTSAVVILFTTLVIRLLLMGERASTTFSRVYCNCAAGVFFFHFVINIAMTIGLFPVVGIPLPFFSYGGSSFLCFTILLFIAIRLDRNSSQHNF